jgi:hypothetical protein
MKIGTLVASLALGGLAVFIGQMDATALPQDGGEGGVSAGPDVIVGSIPDVARYTPGTFNGVEYAAYAIGTTSCNIGTTQLQWQPMPSTLHPTIPQNMYRYANGRFEQIGMSWIKHGFCALQQTLCGTCIPAGSGCPTVLGIGCSDPYTASLNGDQADLKSRRGVNASTGVFASNYTDPTAEASEPTAIRERLRVRRSDLNSTSNPGAQYFVEGQYSHPDDSAAGNDDNNCSYRKVIVGSTWSTTQGYSLTYSGNTILQQPAINAWQTIQTDVSTREYDVSGDGRFIFAYRTSDNGNGTWHYEYAVFNMNSHRSGGSFSIPIPAGVTVTNIEFKSPEYHSGDQKAGAAGYNQNSAWTATVANNAITWSGVPFATDSSANALRWSTMFNFRFDANQPPQAVSATLGLFRPTTATSTATSVLMTSRGPSAPPPPPNPADLDNNQIVDGADLVILLSNWGNSGTGDIDSNGIVDGADLAALVSAWSNG